jgi:hypothetical protein
MFCSESWSSGFKEGIPSSESGLWEIWAQSWVQGLKSEFLHQRLGSGKFSA